MRDSKGRFLKGFKHTEEFEKIRIQGLMGRIVSEETRIKIRNSNLGQKRSEETKTKLSLAKTGLIGSQTNRWKGDKVGNKSLHKWVRKYFPAPELCGFCHEKKKLQLANMTGVYNREFHNWKYICAKCHVYHDGTVYNLTSMNNFR